MVCGNSASSCFDTLFQLGVIGMANGAIIALNAIAISLIYSLVRRLNFAHGDMFALLSVLASVLIGVVGIQHGMAVWQIGLGLLVVIIATMLAGGGASMLIERVGFRPFYAGFKLAPLMATLGISFMLYQAALFVRTLTNVVIPGEHRSVPGIAEVARINVANIFPTTNLLASLHASVVIQFKDLFVLVLAFSIAFFVWWLLERTKIGAMIRACSYDATMAQLCGIHHQGTIRLVFAFGGGLSGIAAVVYAVYYTSPYTHYGATSGLIAFTAALIGGIGKPFGTLWSSLLLGWISALSDYFIAAAWTPAILLGLLIVLLIIRGKPHDLETSSTVAETQRGTPRSWQRWLVLGFGVVILFAPWLNHTFELGILVTLTNILIYVLLAIGLNLSVGWAGMLDLGYAASFALGGYCVGLLSNRVSGFQSILASGEILLVLAVCGTLSGLVGLAIGLLSKRLDNEAMALATFAFAVIVQRTLYNWQSLTGGSSALAGIPNLRLFGWSLANRTVIYYTVLSVVVVVAMLVWNLVRSPIGRAWSALSDDEVVADSMGVPISRMKMLVLALSGAIAGIGGALFATSFSYFSPNSADFQISALVLIMVVIGGSRRIITPMLGAILISTYNLIIIPKVGDYVDRLHQASGNWIWLVLNPRGANFLSFGVLLYLTIWYRARQLRRLSSI